MNQSRTAQLRVQQVKRCATVEDAIAGWDPSYGATGFFAPAKVGSSSWVRTRPVTVNIGNHRFFK